MGELHRGDYVFVFPAEGDAPHEVRGLAGIVKKIRGNRATVMWRNNDNVFVFDVEAQLLHPERRRRQRPPAHWSDDELGATG
jgi:hypothetical protein